MQACNPLHSMHSRGCNSCNFTLIAQSWLRIFLEVNIDQIIMTPTAGVRLPFMLHKRHDSSYCDSRSPSPSEKNWKN
eukprot:6458378-Amphidinium_carterae.4